MRRALHWLTRALDALGRYEHDHHTPPPARLTHHHTGGPLPKNTRLRLDEPGSIIPAHDERAGGGGP